MVLSMAAYGAVLFVCPDYFTGCPNMQPVGEPGCLPPFTPFYFCFASLGVVINRIWLVVPVAMMAKAMVNYFAEDAGQET